MKVKINKNAYYLPEVSLGSRVTIRAYNIIGGRGTLTIGDDTAINEGGSIACTENVVIGKNCILAPRVYILDVDHKFDSVIV